MTNNTIDAINMNDGDVFLIKVNVSGMTKVQSREYFDTLKAQLLKVRETKDCNFIVLPHIGNVDIDNVSSLTESQLAAFGLAKIERKTTH